VAGQSGGKAFFGKLALARPGDPDHGQRAEAPENVDGGRAAAVEKAFAEREVDAQLGQPAARPDPMREERKDGCCQKRGDGAAGAEAQAIRARTPRNQRGQGYCQEFKEQRELRLGRSGAQAAEEKRTRAKPVPGLAGKGKDVARAAGRTVEIPGEGSAYQGKDDNGHGHHGEVAQQRLRSRAAAAQPGIDERHTGDGQRRQQQHSQS